MLESERGAFGSLRPQSSASILLFVDPLLVAALVLATVLLWAKCVWALLIQARHRLKSKEFQYAEDAAHWGGSVASAAPSLTRADRAQNMLRNDAESQPYFFILAILYTLLGCFPQVGIGLFLGYAFLRWLHGIFFIFPKQPLRNWAFSASLVVQLAMIGILVFQVISRI